MYQMQIVFDRIFMENELLVLNPARHRLEIVRDVRACDEGMKGKRTLRWLVVVTITLFKIMVVQQNILKQPEF